jgi:hypothetical protein
MNSKYKVPYGCAYWAEVTDKGGQKKLNWREPGRKMTVIKRKPIVVPITTQRTAMVQLIAHKHA